MKMSKQVGIAYLKLCDLPVVEIINIEDLLSQKIDIQDNGVSVRLSSKKEGHNVFLPSIHNCKDLKKIEEFMNKYNSNYNTIIHRTVKPELIGSASRIKSFQGDFLIMETYKNFEEREKDIIHNRMTIPIYGQRYVISGLETSVKNKEDYKKFMNVFQYLKRLELEEYDLEYVYENDELLFTDLSAYSLNIKDKKRQEKERSLEDKLLKE